MSKEKEVAMVETEVSTIDPNIEKLRAMSGENTGGDFQFIPIIKVSNETIEKEVDGDKVDVLKKAEYLITTMNDAQEFVENPYKAKFEGTILKIRYKVSKKYKKDDPDPFFSSYEFNSFGEAKITLTSNQEEVWHGSYNDFKEQYKEQYTLWAIVYVLVENDEVVRLKLKGNSRANVWDYMKLFGNKDSISAHITEFAIIKEKGPSFSYHIATLKNVGNVEDISKVVEIQEDMQKVFDKKSGDDDENKQEVVDEVKNVEDLMEDL